MSRLLGIGFLVLVVVLDAYGFNRGVYIGQTTVHVIGGPGSHRSCRYLFWDGEIEIPANGAVSAADAIPACRVFGDVKTDQRPAWRIK